MDVIVFIMAYYIAYFWFSRLIRSIFDVRDWQTARLWGAVNTILFCLLVYAVAKNYEAHPLPWQIAIVTLFILTFCLHTGIIKNNLKDK